MNIKFFKQILNQRFYAADKTEQSKILQDITSEICKDFGYPVAPKVSFDNIDSAEGSTKENEINLNTNFLNPKFKYELCLTLIHECIHIGQYLNKEKYEPLLTTPLNQSPFYYFQKTELEAFESTYKIAAEFDEKFKNKVIEDFEANYEGEANAIIGLIKNNFIENNKTSLLDRIFNKTRTQKEIDDDKQNLTFHYHKLSDTQKKQIKQLMLDFTFDRKRHLEYSDKIINGCNNCNNFKFGEVVNYQVDNNYQCRIGRIARLNFNIEGNNLNIFNISLAGNDYFSYDKNDYNNLLKIIKNINKIKSIYEKENHIKLNINISDFIFQFNKQEREQFKKDCMEIFSHDEYNLEDKETILKSKINQSLIQSIYFPNSNVNITNDINNLISFYNLNPSVFNANKKLQDIVNFKDFYDNLENKRLTFIESFIEDLSRLRELNIDKLDLNSLKIKDTRITNSSKNHKNTLENMLQNNISKNDISKFVTDRQNEEIR